MLAILETPNAAFAFSGIFFLQVATRVFAAVKYNINGCAFYDPPGESKKVLEQKQSSVAEASCPTKSCLTESFLI